MKKSILILSLLGFMLLSAVTSLKWRQISDAIPTVTEINFVDGVTSAIQTQLNAKVDTVNLVNPYPIIHAIIDTTLSKTSFKAVTQTAGSILKEYPLGYQPNGYSEPKLLSAGFIYLVAMEYIPSTVTRTGIKTMMVTAGAYTASNFNGVALFKVNMDGTYTRVAISADTPNAWKTAPSTVITIPFTAPVELTEGVYVSAVVYNNSAQTTQPAIYSCGNLSGNLTPLFETANLKISGALSAQTTIPASITVSALINPSFIPLLITY